jgi:hypothetical protein
VWQLAFKKPFVKVFIKNASYQFVKRRWKKRLPHKDLIEIFWQSRELEYPVHVGTELNPSIRISELFNESSCNSKKKFF